MTSWTEALIFRFTVSKNYDCVSSFILARSDTSSFTVQKWCRLSTNQSSCWILKNIPRVVLSWTGSFVCWCHERSRCRSQTHAHPKLIRCRLWFFEVLSWARHHILQVRWGLVFEMLALSRFRSGWLRPSMSLTNVVIAWSRPWTLCHLWALWLSKAPRVW
jgi:hypothetical protein